MDDDCRGGPYAAGTHGQGWGKENSAGGRQAWARTGTGTFGSQMVLAWCSLVPQAVLCHVLNDVAALQ